MCARLSSSRARRGSTPLVVLLTVPCVPLGTCAPWTPLTVSPCSVLQGPRPSDIPIAVTAPSVTSALPRPLRTFALWVPTHPWAPRTARTVRPDSPALLNSMLPRSVVLANTAPVVPSPPAWPATTLVPLWPSTRTLPEQLNVRFVLQDPSAPPLEAPPELVCPVSPQAPVPSSASTVRCSSDRASLRTPGAVPLPVTFVLLVLTALTRPSSLSLASLEVIQEQVPSTALSALPDSTALPLLHYRFPVPTVPSPLAH